MTRETNSETLADIVREMRTYFKTQKRNGNPEHRPWHQVLSDWADRIEAAHAQEVRDAAMEHAVLPAVCITTTPPGNAAATRASLTQLLAWLDAHGDSYTYLDGTPTDEVEAIWQRRQEIVSQARAALDAPPRNCDVGTPEEQAKRFQIFCQTHHEPWRIGMIKNECKCPCLQDNGRSCNYFVWAQMPYKEGGAE